MEKDAVLLKTLFKKAYNMYLASEFDSSNNLLSNTSDIWLDYPQKGKFLALIGFNYYKLNDYSRAERCFMESLSSTPGNLKVLDTLGDIYYTQERYKECERIYAKAKTEDYFNFDFTIKSAKAAWMSGNYLRMFKRLKEGYIPEIIGEAEEKKLKKVLLDFMNQIAYDVSFPLVKRFRKWCYFKKKSSKKNIIF